MIGIYLFYKKIWYLCFWY